MNLLKIDFEIPYAGEKLSKLEVDQLQAKVYKAVESTLLQFRRLADVAMLKMVIAHVDDALPDARRFSERLIKHGLTLEQASALAVKCVSQDRHKGEPERAADAFFSLHGHKYK